MDPTQLRILKHELRTPVNHILGYSELLLETANDMGNSWAVGRAEHLHSVGQTLARAVERSLAHTADPLDDGQIVALRDGLESLARQILELAAPECELHGMNGCGDDLRRIRQAANRLLEMVSGRSVAMPSRA